MAAVFRRFTLLLAAAALAGGLASEARATTIGIAEQKQDFFSDPRFLALSVEHARLNIQWDVLSHPADTQALDAYMGLAKEQGISVLATVDRSRYESRRRHLPSVEEFKRELTALHERYPQVREWSTWNEGNHAGQPTYKHPARVAAYWLALRRICKGCTVLGADLLDERNSAAWAHAFVKAVHRHGGSAPAVWGLHNYIDANLGRTTGTRRVLGAVRGRIWITETAGLVDKSSRGVKLPKGVEHAARTTRFILDKLIRVSSRIQRAYLYMWNATPDTGSWDSAFIAKDNSERPSLGVLRKYLADRRLGADGPEARLGPNRVIEETGGDFVVAREQRTPSQLRRRVVR